MLYNLLAFKYIANAYQIEYSADSCLLKLLLFEPSKTIIDKRFPLISLG